MKPLDLREFAEKLYVSGSADADFGKEIVEYIDGDMTEGYFALCDDIDYYLKDSPPLKEYGAKLQFLGDRSDLVSEIENLIPDYADRLKMAGIETKGRALDDIFGDLLERLPSEWDL